MKMNEKLELTELELERLRKQDEVELEHFRLIEKAVLLYIAIRCFTHTYKLLKVLI